MTNKTIKAAVIGAGWFAAQNHIPVLKQRSEVVLDGVCRHGAAELKRVKDHFGFAFAAEDHRALLARKPDVVVVSSPHHLHYEHTRDALDAGAHVLVEKPMTLDPGQAWDLVALAKKHGRHLLIANGHHYLPQLDDVRTRILGGAVGRIEYVMCSFISATRAVFEGDVGLQRWATTFFRPAVSTWQDPARGGGFVYGQLSHSIAILLWLTGLEPVRLQAHTLSKNGVDLADAASVQFEGGAVGHLGGSASMPEGERALLRLLIGGSEGMMTIEIDRDRAELKRHDGARYAYKVEPGAWVYRCDGPVNALVDLALGRGVNASPGEIGAATVSVMEAMLRSAREGGSAVDLVRGSAP